MTIRRAEVQSGVRATLTAMLLVLLPGAPANAEPDPLRSYVVRSSPPEHFRLTNGLEVVLQRDTAQPLVAVVVAYGAGHAYDPEGHEGLAHLVEHLTFRGSRHVPSAGIYEHLESAGSVRWNGATSPDLAVYYSVVPRSRYALPLWLESERLAFTLERFSEANLELEQARVRKELLQRGLSQRSFDLALNQALYPERHPYRRSEDEIEDVLAADLSDAAWFFQNHYRPDNARLVIVGDFPETMATVVRRYFAPIGNPPGRPSRPRVVVRAFSHRETLTVTEPLLVDGGLTLVFPAPNAADPDGAALDLVVLLLSGVGPWSLEHALVRQNAIAESVSTLIRRGDFASHVYVQMQLRPGVSPERAETIVDGLMARWASFDDAGALREARTSFIVDSLLDIEDPLDRALRHLECLRSFGEPFQFGKHLQRYRSVTVERARTAARRFLNPRARLAARHVDGGRGCSGICISHDSEGP